MVKYDEHKFLPHRLIQKSELFEGISRHFVSEKFFRILAVKVGKEHQPMEWQHEDWIFAFELLIVIHEGSGEVITPAKSVSVSAGDQIYLVNMPHKLLADNDLELELIYLPGPYDAKRFSPTKKDIIHISETELLSKTDDVVVNEIYGKIHIVKIDSIYESEVTSDEALLLICLKGTADIKIGGNEYNLCKGDQIYIYNETFKISNSKECYLEFIYSSE